MAQRAPALVMETPYVCLCLLAVLLFWLLSYFICLTAVSQEAQLATLHGISLPKSGSH